MNKQCRLSLFGLIVLQYFLFSSVSATAQVYDFSKIDELLKDSAQSVGGILGGGVALTLFKDNVEIYSKGFGADYSPQKIVPIASSTKWLSGGVIMSLVDEGKLSLDDSLGKFFPSAPPIKSRMTIRQMMSHTSGFATPQSSYHSDRSLTLAQAADSIIRNIPLIALPGTEFNYGGISMQVAGRIAEIVGGESWDSLFAKRIARPLGLIGTNYEGLGETDNPQIAGGAQSNAEEYLRFVVMLLNHGRYNGQTVLSASAVDEMLQDQTRNAKINETPYSNYVQLDAKMQESRYGVGNWIEVQTISGGLRADNASQGAFGFSPWIDHNRKIVGVLSVRSQMERAMPTYLELKKRIRSMIDAVTDVVDAERGGVQEWEIFPNPVNDKITIRGVKGDLQVFDMFGRKIIGIKPLQSEESMVGDRLAKSGEMYEYDISPLSSGMYVVQMGNSVKILVKK